MRKGKRNGFLILVLAILITTIPSCRKAQSEPVVTWEQFSGEVVATEEWNEVRICNVVRDNTTKKIELRFYDNRCFLGHVTFEYSGALGKPGSQIRRFRVVPYPGSSQTKWKINPDSQTTTVHQQVAVVFLYTPKDK